MDAPDEPSSLATFGGGCFWCLEAVFTRLRGVKTVSSGYSGGHLPNPTYARVCEGDTGHAEVVQVRYDPVAIGYRDLLEVFFAVHDPTTRNRQGNDIGTQYRSIILTHSPHQAESALGLIAELTTERAFPSPIVTEVAPAGTFWPAEDYHQEYFARNGYQPYCQYVVAPKVAKFSRKFRDLLKAG